MCRENFRRTGFSLITMHARLSSKISVAANCWYPEISECFMQIHYLLDCLAGCDEVSF